MTLRTRFKKTLASFVLGALPFTACTAPTHSPKAPALPNYDNFLNDHHVRVENGDGITTPDLLIVQKDNASWTYKDTDCDGQVDHYIEKQGGKTTEIRVLNERDDFQRRALEVISEQYHGWLNAILEDISVSIRNQYAPQPTDK